MKLERILLCVDGSVASLEAARYGIDLAAKSNSRLRVVCVVERPGIESANDPAVMEPLRDSGRRIAARIFAIGQALGVSIEQAVLEGTPFEVILDDARRWNADLVVMGRTGRTGPGRALLGSEAERVLEFSDRPVLIVPTTEPAR